MSAISDAVTSITHSDDVWQLVAPGIGSSMELEEHMWPSGCPVGVQIVEGMAGAFDIYGLTATSMGSMDSDLSMKFATSDSMLAHVGSGATPANQSPAPAPSPDLANLLAWSKEELKGGGNMGALAAYTPKDWEEYAFAEQTINSYVDLAESGYPPDSQEWHRALNDIGQARLLVAMNAEVVLGQRIADRTAHLARDKADLRNAQAALEDVEKTEQQTQRAENVAHWIERVKVLAEAVEGLEAGHDVVHLKAFNFMQLTNAALTVKVDVEGFIQAEGRYFAQVALASHGFASAQELERRLQSAAANVAATAEALHSEAYSLELAQYYHSLPVHH